MPKSPVCFLRAVKFCSTFWHSNWHNFGNILGKVAKLHFLESPQESKRAVEHTIFKFLPFPFFQVSNYCCQKSCNGFRVFLGSSTTSQIFLIYTFLAKNVFEIFTEMHFVSLFFLNERNITTSLLMIHLKCTVVHYTNLNSTSINKPFFNYGLLNMLLLFLQFLI